MNQDFEMIASENRAVIFEEFLKFFHTFEPRTADQYFAGMTTAPKEARIIPIETPQSDASADVGFHSAEIDIYEFGLIYNTTIRY